MLKGFLKVQLIVKQTTRALFLPTSPRRIPEDVSFELLFYSLLGFCELASDYLRNNYTFSVKDPGRFSSKRDRPWPILA